MRKLLLTILILGMMCVMMACKKNSADSAENTAVESSESGEAATFEPMETVDNLQIDLEEGQAGEVAPD